MAQNDTVNPSGIKTFTAGAAISIGQRVTITAGTVAVAGAGAREHGVAVQAEASGDLVAVFTGGGGTVKMIASKAIAIGDRVYGTAAGKVTDTPANGDFACGIALSAGGADGDLIEVAYHPDETAHSA